jgi:hypothetical protein
MIDIDHNLVNENKNKNKGYISLIFCLKYK